MTDVLLVEDLDQGKLPARRLAAVLAEAGLQAGLVHWGGPADSAAAVAQALSGRPRLIVFSVLFAHGLNDLLPLLAVMRAAGVSAHLALAGPLPTLAWRELLAACPALDSVLCGETEGSIVALARAAAAPERWPGVPGLACRTFSGDQTKSAGLPSPPADLDTLPWALRSGPPGHAQRGFATLEASRGCTGHCTFCLVAACGAPYRLRNLAGLVDEIAALYRRGARLFLFDDEQFLPPGPCRRERVAALGKELARRGMQITFTIKCCAGDVEEDLFLQLRNMGLVRAYVGIESGCQATLDLYGKGTTVAQNEQALATLDRLGIVADWRALLFHPWSTLDGVRCEAGFMARLAPHLRVALDMREVEIYPGTPLARRLEQEGCRGAGWPVAYTIPDPRAEVLRRLCRVVFPPGGRYGRMRELVDRAWFELFAGARGRRVALERLRHSRRAAALGEGARRMNGEVLAVLQEMLALAETENIRDSTIVNAGVATWAARINGLRLRHRPAGYAPCAPGSPG